MDSFGATRCTTGRPIGEPAFAGASIGCARCSRTSTRFAWITFVDSLRRGMCQLENPRPKLDIGCQARAPSFFSAVQKELGAFPFFAEDLGVITPDVCALRDQFRIPGTRVLQFAFDGNPENPHLPQHYVPNAVAYTGTHDNNTTRGWFEELQAQSRAAGVEIPEPIRGRQSGGHPSLDASGVVVGCGFGDGSSPGCPQLGKRSTDERARPCRR